VRKKEVEIAVRKMDQAVDELARGRMKAQLQGERLERQAKELEQNIADADSSLRRLREHLVSGGPVEIAGKTYDPDRIREMAEKVLQARKSLAQQFATLKQCRDRLGKAVALLTARENAAKERLGKLKSQFAEIETEMVALKALKDAAQYAGDGDKTFAENFADLEKKAVALQDKVKVETRWEEEKWDNLDAKTDAIIPATKSNQRRGWACQDQLAPVEFGWVPQGERDEIDLGTD
jgi:phage shock protein A